MRKFILIAAALVLASATAQAGDSRSLSTGLTTTMPDEQPARTQEPRAADALRAYNDTPSSTDTPRQLTVTPRPDTETPRYTTRPEAVDSKPPATTTPSTTSPSTTTPSTAQPTTTDTTSRPGRSRHAHADRPHHRGAGTRWTTGRIIAELHRYGIYW